MADTSKRDAKTIGSFAKPDIALIKVTGVNTGTTIAKSGDWILLPEAETGKIKRIVDRSDIVNRTGGPITKRETLIGMEFTVNLLQSDADTIELDKTYAGSDCVLLIKGHYFSRMTSPKQQWLAIFGSVSLSDADFDEKERKVQFMFYGISNTQAVTIGTGGIAFPSLTGFVAPTADITIPVHDGLNGIYKFADQ